MNNHTTENTLISRDELILVTGAAGFIGRRLVENLLRRGFRNLRCFVRSATSAANLRTTVERFAGDARVELFPGNLLSREDCAAVVQDVAVVYHLAAGRGEKSIPDAYLNSVVTTRNLLDALVGRGSVKRFVNVSSFTVYTNKGKPKAGILAEDCPIEDRPQLRGIAYDYAKVKQEEIVAEYSREHQLPSVTVRPGYVYGPGNSAISGRVGIATFGPFLHLGGANPIPCTYVENCAEAIALAGLVPGVDGETFNIVDDDVPTSRQFLRLYKKNVKRFRSFYVPHLFSYGFSWIWEWYSEWSHRQLPPQFNRERWYNQWKKTRYSNERLKSRLGWAPLVNTSEGLRLYFESCAAGNHNA
jgi:nucleoside-diphosphate-sugar epimerase